MEGALLLSSSENVSDYSTVLFRALIAPIYGPAEWIFVDLTIRSILYTQHVKEDVWAVEETNGIGSS